MMEGIVYGIANINFQQNLVEFRDENRTPSNIPMSSPAEFFQQSLQEPTGNSHHISDASSPSETFFDDNSWEETDDENDGGASDNGTPHTKGLTFAERRQLPFRTSKDKSLLGTKRRTIMKPTRRISAVHRDFNSLKPSQIKKMYMNKRLTKFRPTSLETIIEESPNSQSNADNEEDHNKQVTFLGTRKYRRAVTFNDCFFVNKALIKRRRAKIKKVIGRRPALMKISLEEFMDKLNSSMEEQQPTNKPTEDMDEGYCHIETCSSNTSSFASAHVGVVTEETMVLPSAATHEVV